MNFSRVSILFLLVFIHLPFIVFSQPKVVNGVLDLRGLDWDAYNEIPLNGEWEFYWNEFLPTFEGEPPRPNLEYINVPSSWNNLIINNEKAGAKGYGTYRIKMLLDSDVNNLAVKAVIVSTAYKLYINGREVMGAGIPGTSKESTIPKYAPKVNSILESDTMELIVHVSNFDHRLGGIRDSIFIGKEMPLIKNRGNKLLTDLFLAGCFIMMGLYHFLLFMIKREKSPLYFSIFCIIVTVRLFFTGNIPITSYFDINWYWLIRIEYLSFYLGCISFLAYFYSLFGELMHRKFILFVYVLLGIMSAIVLVTPPFFFTNILIAAQVIVLSVIVYSLYILWGSYRKRNKEAIIFFIGYVLLLIFVINDILYADEIIETKHLFSVGVFLFLVSQSTILSRRYALTFKNNELLLERLNVSNKELESKVEERTSLLKNQKVTLMESNAQITLQNKELIKLNKELDNFVYSVSHDLKAPLASMIGLIKLSMNEDNLETLRNYRELMEKSLDRQNIFIGEILDYSRNARLILNKDEIEFEKLLNLTFEQYQFIEGWNIITKEVIVNQKDKFFTDKLRLNIILNNLISNALKYSTIANSSPKVSVKVTADKLNATVEVSDNGSGIPEKHLEHLFKMFYRADDKKSGSGLGLYIAKEALNKLKGSIKVTSEVEKGSTFTFTIPCLK